MFHPHPSKKTSHVFCVRDCVHDIHVLIAMCARLQCLFDGFLHMTSSEPNLSTFAPGHHHVDAFASAFANLAELGRRTADAHDTDHESFNTTGRPHERGRSLRDFRDVQIDHEILYDLRHLQERAQRPVHLPMHLRGLPAMLAAVQHQALPPMQNGTSRSAGGGEALPERPRCGVQISRRTIRVQHGKAWI